MSRLQIAMSQSEAACVYAALILHDDNVPITAEKIRTLVEAAGFEGFDSIYADVYAKNLAKLDIKQLLSGLGSGPSTAGAPATTGAAPAASAAAKKEPAKKVEEPPKEDDEDIGSLFN
jgi:large subunit ribosomal protein LP1